MMNTVRERDYEVIFIMSPETEEEDRENIRERIEDYINNNGGEVKESDEWDERKLAYEIRGYNNGYYTVIDFEAETSMINDLDYEFKIINDVLRNMIINKEE